MELQEVFDKVVSIAIGEFNTPELRKKLCNNIPGLICDETLNTEEVIKNHSLRFIYNENMYSFGISKEMVV